MGPDWVMEAYAHVRLHLRIENKETLKKES